MGVRNKHFLAKSAWDYQWLCPRHLIATRNMKQDYPSLEYLPTKSTFVIQSKYFYCPKQLRLRTAYNPSLPSRRKNGRKEGKDGTTGELESQLCLEVCASFILANVLTVEIGKHGI